MEFKLTRNCDEIRICNACNKPITEGYVIGDDYYGTKECMSEKYTEEEYNELYDEDENYAYFTSWIETMDDDFLVCIDGLVELWELSETINDFSLENILSSINSNDLPNLRKILKDEPKEEQEKRLSILMDNLWIRWFLK